jgi:hypothetical protein
MEKYRYGVFATVICSKASDLDGKTAFEFQPMKSIYEAQELAERIGKWRKKKQKLPSVARHYRRRMLRPWRVLQSRRAP